MIGFAERHPALAGANEVIQNWHPHDPAGLHEASRHLDVLRTGLGVPRRVVVGHDHGRAGKA